MTKPARIQHEHCELCPRVEAQMERTNNLKILDDELFEECYTYVDPSGEVYRMTHASCCVQMRIMDQWLQERGLDLKGKERLAYVREHELEFEARLGSAICYFTVTKKSMPGAFHYCMADSEFDELKARWKVLAPPHTRYIG